jgi:uncharacterized membrane protein YidH (DUF202 family)
MNWTRFALAIVASGVAISITDWFFFGFVFHGKYMKTPELWRATKESHKIAWSMFVAVCAAAFFLHFCWHFDVHGYHQTLSVAFFLWLAAALPMVITNTLYIKYDPALAVSHSLGWLARFVVTALAYVLLMS